MKRNQQGFTLIELIIVIVILGILAAVALPKFVDLSGEAEDAAVKGVAGGISSGMSINYAARKVSSGNANTHAVTNCQDGEHVLDGGLPEGYSITAHAVSANATYPDCVLTGPSGKTASFTAIGI
jgi:MSHA pilin protein MshA